MNQQQASEQSTKTEKTNKWNAHTQSSVCIINGDSIQYNYNNNNNHESNAFDAHYINCKCNPIDLDIGYTN